MVNNFTKLPIESLESLKDVDAPVPMRNNMLGDIMVYCALRQKGAMFQVLQQRIQFKDEEERWGFVGQPVPERRDPSPANQALCRLCMIQACKPFVYKVPDGPVITIPNINRP